MRFFNCPDRLTPNGLTGSQLVERMATSSISKKAAKMSDIQTGPATRAKVLVQKWKKGYRPSYAPERNQRFISSVTDAGYGASKYPYFGHTMKKVIEKQDKKRQNRLMSEKMFRLMCVTDAHLMLPGPTVVTEIVSVAGTRALGYAPQIEPPALIPLECKYQMGERPDMAIEVVDDNVIVLD